MALHPLHAVWRRLPPGPRRWALLHGTRALAPYPDQPPPPVRPGLAVAGELDRASGLGEGARLMLAGLEALGVPAWAVRPGDAPPPPGVPLLLHVNAPGMPLALLRLGRAMIAGRRVIGHWAWELPATPPAWRVGVGFVHEIWAPSRFTADALEPLLPGHVRLVPYPVATRPPVPSSLSRADLGLPGDAVVTLVSFNLASSFARKNPLGAIAAHRQAFGTRADRVLLLRVGNPGDFPDDFDRIRAAVSDLPNAVIDTRTLSMADNHAVMALSDIVLSLHRSEGFGLVPAEAMLLGVPVIATDWSGTQDFLDAECAALVPCRLVPARDPRGVFEAPGAVWAEPDVAAAAAALRRLADDPAARRALGGRGRAAAQSRLGTAPLAAALAGLQ